ncbi:tRNA 2-thiouridine(34) synthase MnmA ['Camptotheca acuminata' phytoplasma]|uniref:tRNA 2-thiouridine(34) synthase MnmA n=1 Tax='Camptotheca acuminata' phytoplasma TaxID=3239192 RepID=UPI00351A38ED
MKKKVIVGLSGGVDSSVAAFLLQKEGYEVEAIFMRNWDSSLNYDVEGNPNVDEDVCPQEQDYQDALKVAKQLNIKFHRVDFSEEYWNQVFTFFLNDLKKNLTPNPDVLCNNKIKFLAFIEYAKQFNPDYIAMGHYARIIFKDNKNMLATSLDVNKDQTYFLSQLKPEQLNNIIFPLGNKTKKEVREIALRENLITATKKDSTGICFIGERKFFVFLNNYLPPKKGPIKDMNGSILKEHEGVFKYTIGQRKGLNLKVSKENQSPWFVVGKDLKTNTLYVDQNNDSSYLYSDACLVTDVVWRDKHFKKNKPKKILAKFRYRQSFQEVEIFFIDKNTIKVVYPQKIKSVTPGQICAFYDGDFCLGAGVIQKVYSGEKQMLYV